MKNKSKLKNQKNKVTDTFPLNKPVGKIMSFSKKESKEEPVLEPLVVTQVLCSQQQKEILQKLKQKNRLELHQEDSTLNHQFGEKSMSKKNWRGAR